MRRYKSRLGGAWFSSETDEEIECLNRANNSTQVRQIDSIITDLGRNWKPTGFYAPADMQKLLTMIATESEAAAATLKAAPFSTGDAVDAKNRAFNDLLDTYKNESYPAAVAKARQTGAEAISAPGFKDYVIKAMRSISNTYVTAAVLQCRETWLESILDKSYRAIAAIGAVAAAMIGAIVDLTKGVIKASGDLARLLALLVKWAPWVAVGGAGIFAVSVVRKRPQWLRRKLPPPPPVAGRLMPPR